MTVEMRPDALERMVTQKGGSAEVAVSGTLDSISEKNGWCTMILTGVEVEDESVRKVLISCKSDLLEMCEEKILPPCGSQIHLTGTAEFLEEARNPGQFSYRMYYRGLGIRNRVTADQIFISEGKSSPLRSQAECFRAGEIPEQNTMVYYDENVQPSDPETAAYYVTVTDQPEETAAGTLHTGIITAHTIDGTEIYTLNVAAYLPGEG